MLQCLGSKQKRGSKPKSSLECDTITEGLRTGAMLRGFQEKDNVEHGERFPEKSELSQKLCENQAAVWIRL